jgi:two-component system sensor histidine kinase KdpD
VLIACAVAVGSLALATVAVAILQDGLGVPNPSLVYLVAVVATALVAGTAGAVTTAIAAFLLYNFLFTEPRFTLTMHEPGVWLNVVLLLFVGIVVGQLVALQRARAAATEAREREARALFRISRALATRSSTEAVLSDIAANLRTETRMDGIWIALGANEASEKIVAIADADDDQAPHVARGVKMQLRRMPGDEPARWVRVHEPSRRAPAPSADDVFRIGIAAADLQVGSIWGTRPRNSGLPGTVETRLLSAAADQIGQAVVQDRFRTEAQAAAVATESDALKSALLQSVSHDLRTPLATIRTAAGTLQSGRLDPGQRASAEAIEREVEYLNRLVTNLLDLSRIEAGALRADSELLDLDDAVRDAIDRHRLQLDGRRIDVSIDVSPVRADPVFLAAALSNILDNVARYTPGSTSVNVTAAVERGERVRLTVEDSGPGVPPESLGRLFDKFFQAPAGTSGRHGTGIGLSVVRGLVEAMGGHVSARRSELGGLAIDIDLPAGSMPVEEART